MQAAAAAFSATPSLCCKPPAFTSARAQLNSDLSTLPNAFGPSSKAIPSVKWAQKTVVIHPQRRGCHLVTSKIVREIEQDLTGFKCGLAHLFLQHTSASLTINENCDSDVRHDTETFLNQIVPEGWSAPWKHTLEGDISTTFKQVTPHFGEPECIIVEEIDPPSSSICYLFRWTDQPPIKDTWMTLIDLEMLARELLPGPIALCSSEKSSSETRRVDASQHRPLTRAHAKAQGISLA